MGRNPNLIARQMSEAIKRSYSKGMSTLSQTTIQLRPDLDG